MLPIIRTRNSFPTFADNFFNNNLLDNYWNENLNQFSPSVNIVENEKNFIVEVAVPGINKKDFKINVEDKVLEISFEAENKEEKKEENFLRQEFSRCSFTKRFALPENVEGDKILAGYVNGILSIEIPKVKEKAKLSRLIKIS